MKRPEWVKKLFGEGKSEEEIIKALEKGDKKLGIAPWAQPFVKFGVKKILAKLK